MSLVEHRLETVSRRHRRVPGVALVASITAILLATPGRAQLSDAVTEWNGYAVGLTLLPASALAPVQQARAMAAVHVSVHDAINVITGDYQTYTGLRAVDPHASSPEAAAIAAAHDSLVALFPTHAATLQTLFDTSLVSRGLSPDDPGVAVGKAVASAVLSLRANDGAAMAQFNYVAPGAGEPGVWVHVTAAPALLPGWGQVTPWVLRTGSQFRPGPPPPLGSGRYTRDFVEVQALGSANSSTRTGTQTEIAQFWRASPTAIWNAVMLQMLETQGLGLASTAQAFGVMYLAAADASIACWDAKYAYNFWRPQPAIAAGGQDGNDATTGDVMDTARGDAPASGVPIGTHLQQFCDGRRPGGGVRPRSGSADPCHCGRGHARVAHVRGRRSGSHRRARLLRYSLPDR